MYLYSTHQKMDVILYWSVLSRNLILDSKVGGHDES